jgi:hypothetical protein
MPRKKLSSELHTVDIGNFSTFFLAGGDINPGYFRSLRAKLTPGTRQLRFDASNPLVSWSPQGEDVTYHFGAKAGSYRQRSASAVENKISNVETFVAAVLASIAPKDGINELDVKLRWAMPNPDLKHSEFGTYAQYFKRALTGQFKYTRNGENMVVTIEPEDPQYEGYASLVSARKNKMLSQKGNLILLDLGGNTVNGLVIDQSNEIIDSESFEGRGGVGLATEIAANKIVLDRIGDALDIGVVMDGIADGTNSYYGESKNHWRDVYEDILKEWYGSLMSKMQRRFRDHLPNTKGVMLIGGCANLLTDLLQENPLIYIPEKPELANILAMCESSSLELVAV